MIVNVTWYISSPQFDATRSALFNLHWNLTSINGTSDLPLEIVKMFRKGKVSRLVGGTRLVVFPCPNRPQFEKATSRDPLSSRARDLLRPVWGREAWGYHEPGPPRICANVQGFQVQTPNCQMAPLFTPPPLQYFPQVTGIGPLPGKYLFGNPVDPRRDHCRALHNPRRASQRRLPELSEGYRLGLRHRWPSTGVKKASPCKTPKKV